MVRWQTHLCSTFTYLETCFYQLDLDLGLLLSMMNHMPCQPAAIFCPRRVGWYLISPHGVIRCIVHNDSTVWKDLGFNSFWNTFLSFLYDNLQSSLNGQLWVRNLWIHLLFCTVHNQTSSSSCGSRQCCFWRSVSPFFN